MLIDAEDLSKLLEWHIENGAYFDSELYIDTMREVVEFIKTESDENESKEKIEAKEFNAFMNKLTEKYVEIIKAPSPFSTKMIFDLIGRMSASQGSKVLEQCILIKKVKEVPGIAERAMGIRPIVVRNRPNRIIYYYYEQCVNCYINGLIEAASAMARSVLDYSLREKLKTDNKVVYISFVKGKDNLHTLIETCKDANILTGDLADVALKVKRKGDDAVHKRPLEVNEVKLQIEYLGDILQHIYK